MPGHRSDVRALALSSDGNLLLSCSHSAIKVQPVVNVQFWSLLLESALSTTLHHYAVKTFCSVLSKAWVIGGPR